MTIHIAGDKRHYDYDRDPLNTYAPYTFRAYDAAAEGLKASNRIIVQVDLPGHVGPVLFAVPVLGK